MENNSQLATTLLFFFIKKCHAEKKTQIKFRSSSFHEAKNPVYTDNIFY